MDNDRTPTREDAEEANRRFGLGSPQPTPQMDLIKANLDDMLLRVEQVAVITSLSVPTIYREMGLGNFPKPVKLTHADKGARAWRLSDVKAWMRELPYALQ